jgi:hypothetical protein
MEIYFDHDLPSDVEIPLSHASESEAEHWKESDYNYRLNSCDTKIYAVINKKVVGHLGIVEDESTVRRQSLICLARLSGSGHFLSIIPCSLSILWTVIFG